MKQKTRKSILKRFKLTGTGKLLRRRQNSRHLRRHKSKKLLRKYRTTATVGSAIAKKYIRQISA